MNKHVWHLMRIYFSSTSIKIGNTIIVEKGLERLYIIGSTMSLSLKFSLNL
jgi:hypothetical protein